MSLILDALRKSEAERRRGKAPSLYAAMPVPGTRAPPGLVELVAAGGAGGAAGGRAVYLVQRSGAGDQAGAGGGGRRVGDSFGDRR
jgi:hypothetical protein